MKKYIKEIIFYITFIFSLILLIFLSNIVYTQFFNKICFENYIFDISDRNISNVFKIDKIVFFSSCHSDSTINSNNTTTINNLQQYTDIAIFINNSNTNYTLENTLKSVSINNISFNVTPVLGTPNLYYKSLNDFAKPQYDENNLIDSDLTFSISSEDNIDYSKPILYNNCANPITLSYVNSGIKDNYTISNENNSIIYDGSLLKRCNILLNDLSTSISFTINIENNLGDKFSCPVYLNIPLQGGNSSIYNGSYTYTYNPGYNFYKY